ncbi:hypothetical protein ACKTEK_11095 [Tepidamorphus sp. 3E244]|uniref:hypothetical protein n=1 Tax=Tepidamorphus sp. 3E244 TaxID=3385498 RepID=UPI0038FD1ADF
MWQALAFGGVLVGMAGILALAPRDGAQVAVFMPPWAEQGDAMRAAAAARLDVVAVGSNGRVAILAAVDRSGVSRLYASGAVLVADAAIARACLTTEPPKTEQAA